MNAPGVRWKEKAPGTLGEGEPALKGPRGGTRTREAFLARALLPAEAEAGEADTEQRERGRHLQNAKGGSENGGVEIGERTAQK